MLNKIWQLIKRPHLTAKLLSMGGNGYLFDIGWVNTVIKNTPVDSANNPIPWVTYPFISFMDTRLDKGMAIFEYGSGASTMWYSKKVGAVYSVEHDKQWYEDVKVVIPSNSYLYYEQLEDNGSYANFPVSLKIEFDVIIVDGRDRVNCIHKSIPRLNTGGVIVLDDSEREIYKEGIQSLRDQGFRQLDFWGISPGCIYHKCTSVFYKDANCLGI